MLKSKARSSALVKKRKQTNKQQQKNPTKTQNHSISWGQLKYQSSLCNMNTQKGKQMLKLLSVVWLGICLCRGEM